MATNYSAFPYYDECFALVLDYFNSIAKNDSPEDRASRWFRTRNPLLGGLVPYEMIRAGRGLKLIEAIRLALEANQPPPVV